MAPHGQFRPTTQTDGSIAYIDHLFFHQLNCRLVRPEKELSLLLSREHQFTGMKQPLYSIIDLYPVTISNRFRTSKRLACTHHSTTK
jgi:hypothetical protein